MSPRVTVLMPVYNGERFLREAVESILNQTYRDFEFLIINDGSKDRSVEIIESYHDPRIKLVHNEKNLGLITMLNKGIEIAEGRYIARMDADDISLPERLQKQVSFMDIHQEIAVCGTWLETIAQHRDVWKHPVGPDEIKCKLLFAPPLAHPSVMIRRSIFVNNNFRYDLNYKYAEDYRLWVQISKKHPMANINEVLFRYRLHETNVGAIHCWEQRNISDRIQKEQLIDLGLNFTDEELLLHSEISIWKFQDSSDFLEKADIWFLRILNANEKTHVYSQDVLQQVLAERWAAMCFNATALGMNAWKMFLISPLSNYCNSHLIKKLGFLLQCGLKLKSGKVKK